MSWAGSVPVVFSFGARDILRQSSSCDSTVSLTGPDSQDDSPGMRAQEQVETVDRTLGSNYEQSPTGLLKGNHSSFKSIKKQTRTPVKG